jgi:hypothetical protein
LNPLRATLRYFDAWLSRQYRIRVFTTDPLCMLRIQLGQIPHPLELKDGPIPRGAPALMIHWWNERTALIEPQGPTIAWALDTSRRMRHSLRLIAQSMKSEDANQEIRVVGGITAMVVLGKVDGGKAMLEHLGFIVIPYYRPLGAFGEFWENFYTW